jgi:glycosyltransferase involved in cell wall biosynthesis
VNILALTSGYPKSPDDSTAPFIGSIVEHVAALGHTVHVVLPEHVDWARAKSEGNVHFHPYRYSPLRTWTPWGYAQSLEDGVRLKRQLYALAPIVYASAARTCRRLTASERFDLVHAHWLIPNGAIAAGFCRSRQLPLVVSLHGSDISIVERKPWLARAARRAFARTDAITAPSRDLLERASRLGASGDLRLMPYGADPRRFRPEPESAATVRARYGLNGTDVVVLGIGRFVRWKGFDDLIASIGNARERVPAVKLVLVGDGDLRGELEAQARAIGDGAVAFAGIAARDEVSAYFAAADIVVVPSVHADGFVDGQPNVALEAMAAAKPLVVTNVGGLPDLVRNEQCGLTVKERDRGELAAAIVALARDPERRAAMGAAGRARVADELNWDTYAQRLVDVYESAIRTRDVRP